MDAPMIVLTQSQLVRAYKVGCARHATHENAGRFDPKIYRGNGELIHVRGAAAELAVASYFNLTWDGAFFNLPQWEQWRRQGHDVGPLEVRTNMRWHGILRIRPHESGRSPFIFVRSDMEPIFYLIGWIFGGEVKKRENWRADSRIHHYAIDYTKLRPIAELTRMLNGENLINE